MFVQRCAQQGMYEIVYVYEMDFEINLAYIFRLPLSIFN